MKAEDSGLERAQMDLWNLACELGCGEATVDGYVADARALNLLADYAQSVERAAVRKCCDIVGRETAFGIKAAYPQHFTDLPSVCLAPEGKASCPNPDLGATQGQEGRAYTKEQLDDPRTWEGIEQTYDPQHFTREK